MKDASTLAAVLFRRKRTRVTANVIAGKAVLQSLDRRFAAFEHFTDEIETRERQR